MVVRSEGPLYNIGFSHYRRPQNDRFQTENVEGPDQESGMVAKAMHANPIMGFLAASAATIVGMGVAGKLVKQGGVKLGIKLSQTQNPATKELVKSFRDVQRTLDDMQGVSRRYADPDDPTKLFVRNADGKYRSGGVDYGGDEKEIVRNFYINRGEVEAARTAGKDQLPHEWAMKDEIQQRLVAQARRLPYELPAAYAAQRAIVDPLFGRNEDSDVNWFNPVDVVTDFVDQSVKNLMFMLGPFEAGTGAASHSYRRLFSYGGGTTPLDPRTMRNARTAVSIQASLKQIGHDASRVTDRIVKFSSQSSGAFAAGVEEAASTRIGIVDMLHQMRSGDYKAALKQQNTKAKKALHIADKSPGFIGGTVSGFKKGRARFNEIGQGHDAFQKMMRLGNSKLIGAEREAVKNFTGESFSPITSLAVDVRNLGKGAPGISKTGDFTKDWTKSGFYNNRIQDEYHSRLKSNLKRQLENSGHDKSTASKLADDFAEQHSIDIPKVEGTDISHRFRVGKSKQILVAKDRDEFISRFVGLTGRIDSADQAYLSKTLGKVIDQTDNEFVRRTGQRANPFRAEVDRKIQRQWLQRYENDLPEMAGHMFGKRAPGYHSFDMKPGGIDHDYLIGKAIQASNISSTASSGSTAVQKAFLKKMGLDADSPEVLRGYLVGKKQISKPWQEEGFNAFGFRKITTGQFLSRNLHGGDAEIGKVINHLGKTSDDRFASTIPGIYETRSGNVINVNKMRRSGRRALDVMSNEYKIPIVNFNPLQLMGYGRNQGMAESSVLSYVSGGSRQPFLPGRPDGDEAADFFLMLRRKGTKGKGEVRSFTGDVSVGTSLGEFQPTSASSVGLAGKHARIASGDTGRGPIEGAAPKSGKLRERARSFFLRNNDSYQQGSMRSVGKRSKNRNSDVRNPVTMARLLRGESVADARGSYALRGGEVINTRTGTVAASKEEVAGSLDVFHRFVAKNVYPKALHDKATVNETAGEALKKVQKILSYNLKDKTGKSASAATFIGDLKTVDEKVTFARNMLRQEDEEVAHLFATGRDTEARQLGRAKETLIDSHLKDSSGAGYWDKPVGDTKRGTGIARRIDELTSDMQQYLVMRQGIVDNTTFAATVEDFGTQLRELRKAGVLSANEAVEANAALLSTQIHFSKIKNFDTTAPTVNTALKVISDIQSSTVAPLRSALEDVASGLTGATGGSNQILNRGHQLSRRFLSMSDETYEGFSYSPFGNTDTVFTPTFNQAVRQTGAKNAILSAAGVTTYRNPQAFSPTSAFTSHLFDRLNRYANVFGAGVDPTKFSGPLDMFGRGMVGQRALPLYAAGATALAADSTVGGLLNERDSRGGRVYSPYFLGKVAAPFAHLQAGVAGAVPGGLGYEEARDQIFEGEVAVRRNRFWPLNRTPFRGEGAEYFRPSWYRRLQAGSPYAESGWENPTERLLFGHDFSPLRPLDPYRYENKHYADRPYPLTGDYFTGPFGPVTPLLNATVGKILKPQREMHVGETSAAINAGYAPVGESGAFSTIPYGVPGPGLGRMSSYSVLDGLGATSSGDLAQQNIGRLINNSQTPQYTASGIVRESIDVSNYMLVAQSLQGGAAVPNSAQASYGIPNLPGIMPPTIIPNRTPVTENGFQFQARSTAYRTQEALGIYGFGFGAIRSSLGFGDQDFTPTSPVLQNASAAYGSGRAFWDLNIGGIGDAPSETLNLNLSEVVRRFIPKTPSGINFINPIPNTMGVENPWLPGSDHYIDFTRGDPFTSVKEGEIRLPGQVYERLNKLNSDSTGRYGIVDQHKILGDVAPFSQQFKAIDGMIDGSNLSTTQKLQVATTREQVERVSQKNTFNEYSYDEDATFNANLIERGLHMDNMITRKLGRHSSAVEDWERKNVYGPTFQQWQTPVDSFLMPMVNESTQRNPVSAAGRMGFAAGFFGRTPTAKLTASALGAITGGAAGTYGKVYEAATGNRFMPKERKKQAALEEYSDVLSYVKSRHLQQRAEEAGDAQAASTAERASRRTMYGIDLASASVRDILAAVPKRKREHFESFLQAPEQEHERILSTAPRLERRMLQAAWGMKVEGLPSLGNFFEDNELPGEGWEGWHPNTNMDQVKIKIGQHMGLDMSQMGYYPQQVQQANLVNPSFPVFGFQSDSRNTRVQLESLMSDMGIQGSVSESSNPFSGSGFNLSQVLF
jgi:hypothetical protein